MFYLLIFFYFLENVWNVVPELSLYPILSVTLFKIYHNHIVSCLDVASTANHTSFLHSLVFHISAVYIHVLE